MRPSVTAALSVVLIVLWATPAAAHVGLVPSQLAPDSTVEAQLVVVHGCGPEGTMPMSDDEATPTEAIVLEVPDGLTMTPLDVAGWTVSTTADAGTTRIRWDANVPADGMDIIRLDLEVVTADLEDRTELWLPVIQECEQDEVMAWTHEGPVEEMTDLAAARVIVGQPPGAADDSGLSTTLVIVLAIAFALVAGGAVFAVSGRRG